MYDKVLPLPREEWAVLGKGHFCIALFSKTINATAKRYPPRFAKRNVWFVSANICRLIYSDPTHNTLFK